ncbi:transglutaminase-like domain-containing protein [Exiguobacterium sp. B2(2022)]|uniref:transglutaminase-like domain-containing protein n=1 Tax=Exiguobacterium sp. B2(2022) TaxID=2992755 RepID=UPI00237BA690|nr:transglutaminase domain-containing protein [Exiguobacterium sp. B2(2022)]MDE0564229.1 transglutaminase domain-containing protein [Exiguobacterium sp. B2(2022)]
MKKFFTGMLVLLFALIVLRPAAVDAASTRVDTRTGKVDVYISSQDKGSFKLEIRQGKQVRYHDVYKGKNHFNLNYGNGDYTFALYQSSDGKRYKRISLLQKTVRLIHSSAPYLHSTQNVFIDRVTSRLASSLSRSSYSTSQQTLVTSRHVGKTIAYDYKKLTKLTSTYLPDHATTLRTKRGICYDFASLNAALLRAQGIPTRLVMGSAKGVTGYHAWNEVFISGKWRIVDVTRDVTEKRTTTFRSASDYRASIYY